MDSTILIGGTNIQRKVLPTLSYLLYCLAKESFIISHVLVLSETMLVQQNLLET